MMLRPVMVAGQSARPSVFSSTATFAFRPILSGTVRLGAEAAAEPTEPAAPTPAEWYARAKAAVAKFAELWGRTERLGNGEERQKILEWVGVSSRSDTPAYHYMVARTDIREDVERFIPPNVDAYKVERRIERVKKLEELVKEFETKVVAAEAAEGKASPAVPGVPAAAPEPAAEGLDLTVPAVVGGGALAVALIATLAGRR